MTSHDQELLRAPFRNQHLSVSRLRMYVQCPLRFKLSYVDHHREERGKDAASLGRLVHRALELIYRHAKDHQWVGIVPDQGVIRFYRQAFEHQRETEPDRREQEEIVTDQVYREGLQMVRSYLAGRMLDHHQIVALEQVFDLPLDEHTVHGYIDRVDRIDSITARVVDYKTSRYAPTREEIDHDLQMSVYGLAVLQILPWVQHVQYELEMVRHSITLSTSRTPQQLMDTAHYVVSLGRMIESAERMPARLNAFCSWCDHRRICHAYQDALQRGEGELRTMIAEADIERLSAERERAAILKKIATQRLKEVDRLLKEHVMRADPDKRLVVGDRRYRMVQRWDADYPREETMELLSRELDLPREQIERRLVRLNGEAIQRLLREMRLSTSRYQLITMRLQQIADRAPCRPYISSSDVCARR